MKPASTQLLIVVTVCLMFIVGTKVYLEKYQHNDVFQADVIPMKSQFACDLNQGCQYNSAGLSIELIAEGKLTALKPFKLIIKPSASATIKNAQADFTMQGMNMGVNQYQFKRRQENAWQAEVILPLCNERRMDWNMEIRVSTEHTGQNKQYIILMPISISSR